MAWRRTGDMAFIIHLSDDSESLRSPTHMLSRTLDQGELHHHRKEKHPSPYLSTSRLLRGVLKGTFYHQQLQNFPKRVAFLYWEGSEVRENSTVGVMAGISKEVQTLGVSQGAALKWCISMVFLFVGYAVWFVIQSAHEKSLQGCKQRLPYHGRFDRQRLCDRTERIQVLLIPSIYNLTNQWGNQRLWLALLDCFMGYLLPNPSIKPWLTFI